MKRHVITTACDARYGDFLVCHWLRSLQENVNLSNIDVVVLDYGLSRQQSTELEKRVVVCRPCRKDMHIVSARFRDLAELSREGQYDQMAIFDGGDIIFQADISPLFEQHQDRFRAATEPNCTGMLHHALLGPGDIRPEYRQELFDYLRDRPVVNGGVIVGPARLYSELYSELNRLAAGLTHFGTDQLVVSWFMYRHDFVPLDERYNFILISTQSDFRVRG